MDNKLYLKTFINYYKQLYLQFCMAKGIPTDGINLDKGFSEWQVSNAILCQEYKKYVMEINSKISECSVAEIDKGFLDTISRGSENIEMISSYAPTLNSELPNGYLLTIKDDTTGMLLPCVKSETDIKCLKHDIILTHNPYYNPYFDPHYNSYNNLYYNYMVNLINLGILHNQGTDISLGVYGDLNDMDRNQKIQLLKSLREVINDDHTFCYDTDNGKYFASLNSKRKQKSLSLIKR